MHKIILMLISITIVIASCSTIHNQNMPTKPIEVILAQHTDELMSIPGVVGTAQGLQNDKPCITVLVIKDTPELRKKIPKTIEGYPVLVLETGEIQALPEK